MRDSRSASGVDCCRLKAKTLGTGSGLEPPVCMPQQVLPVKIRPCRLFGSAKWTVWLILAALIPGPDRLAADTVPLSPVADTFISEHFPEPNGAGVDMVIGTQGALAGAARDRCLIKFDFSVIPDGATINSATVHVTVTHAPTGV